MVVGLLVSLAVAGWAGASKVVWLVGGGVLTALTIFKSGYWRPQIWRQIVATVGPAWALLIAIAILGFNFGLAFLALRLGEVIHWLWQTRIDGYLPPLEKDFSSPLPWLRG